MLWNCSENALKLLWNHSGLRVKPSWEYGPRWWPRYWFGRQGMQHRHKFALFQCLNIVNALELSLAQLLFYHYLLFQMKLNELIIELIKMVNDMHKAISASQVVASDFEWKPQLFNQAVMINCSTFEPLAFELLTREILIDWASRFEYQLRNFFFNQFWINQFLLLF